MAWNRARTWALVFGLFLLAASVGGAISLVSAADTYPLDANHELASGDAVDTYADEGYVTARNVGGLDLRVSIAESHGDVGLDGLYTDVNAHYLRVQYNESIDRTIRLYLPAGYWHPHVKQDLEAENAGVTADLEPAENGDYTAVTMHLDGKTDAVFRVSKEASLVFEVRDEARTQIENLTGFDLPSLPTGGVEWQYPAATMLAGNNTTGYVSTNGEDLTLQYDADDSLGNERWLSIPRCENSLDDQAVCTFTRDDESERVYLLSRQSDPPDIRYRTGTSMIEDARASVNEVLQGIDRMKQDIDEWLAEVL